MPVTHSSIFNLNDSYVVEKKHLVHESAMFPVERALLIINQAAGTGQSYVMAGELSAKFKQSLSLLSDVKVELVGNHDSARACALQFLRESQTPAVIVAGGGGGTLRAVVESICEGSNSNAIPGPERVRVGALRLGSGNVLARRFGVPRDPVAALDGLVANLKSGQTASCCVMRYEVWNSEGHSEFSHGVTLGGLGQFGRIPSDLARWHSAASGLHKSAARWFDIERLTNLEYAFTLLIRFVCCTVFPNSVETVELHVGDHSERMRLLSGIVMNFPVGAIPFNPGVRVESEEIVVYMIPFRGRLSTLKQLLKLKPSTPHTLCIRLKKNQRLEIRFVDRNSTEVFLDEDSLLTYGRLDIEIAGSIAFVPGPDYQPMIDQ